ncbi:MAG: fused MFS/spermidine synthase [Gammaproteobacteria bacterium]|nr:fused MFS/spermidine synthase [Gammaproteobacteria bacterium]MBL4729740.1 fused MFS/spermidine synthase [Gammaproteobacteria bacterium]
MPKCQYTTISYVKLRRLLFFLIASPFTLSAVEIDAAEIVHHSKSLYQDIYVRDDGNLRCMQFSSNQSLVRNYQGCIYLANRNFVFKYTEALLGALLMQHNPKRILVIGLGAAVIPRALSELMPHAFIEVVEIDQEVAVVARQYFGWDDENNPLLRTYITDGRVFVKRVAQLDIKYDLVVLDAFNSEYIPPHLSTQDFFLELKSITSDEGVIASNTFSSSNLYDHESVTYTAAFGDFYNVQLEGKAGNRVVLAYPNRKQDQSYIRVNAAYWALPFYRSYGINVNDLLVNMDTSVDWDHEARVLTDQYSPINVLRSRPPVDITLSQSVGSFFEQLADESPILAAILIITIILSVIFIIFTMFRLRISFRTKNSTIS